MYYIFTDGSSSRKNKTIGTSYVLFENEKIIKKFSKGFTDEGARNGIAELLGVYYFLQHLFLKKIIIDKSQQIIILSDSQYVVNECTIWFKNQLIKNFFEVKNKEIIFYILFTLSILKERGYNITFEWTKGHQEGTDFKVLGNNLADSLAVNCHKDNNKLDNIETNIDFLKKRFQNSNILFILKQRYLNL